MNTTQTNAIESIKKAMLEGVYLGTSQVELKKCEIRESSEFVSLVIEVGHVGDEGSMAEVLCRDCRQFFIGKRGGVSLASLSVGSRHKSFGFKQVNGLWNAVHKL